MTVSLVGVICSRPAMTQSLSLTESDSALIAPNDTFNASPKPLRITSDSLISKIDSLISQPDSLKTDSIKVDSIVPTPKRKLYATIPPSGRFKREQVDLENIVEFKAKDSLVYFGDNNAKMYNGSEVKYGDINLQSYEIGMHMNENEVSAVGALDSVGELQGNPIFKDPSGTYESKRMRYNFKTEKGYIEDVVTEQGEGYLSGGVTKKMPDGYYYLKDGKYSTCDDHEHPHFYMNITKGKVKPQKNIVTGPAYMVLCDVPLPLAVPFGFFPFSSTYSSGIIFPTFGEDYNRGFYLREGGYYFAINNNIDLALTGEIYTKGSWGIGAQSTYVKRYKFAGSFSMNYLVTVNGDKGSADYSKGTNFRVTWNHSQDSKANPNLTFSASVNFATSGYNRNDISAYYTTSQFTENTKSSTVNLTYKFPNSKWSISANANINQRSNDSTLSVSLPNFTVTMSQINPFKRKRAVGSEKWYEKITLSYTGRLQNSLTAKQNVFFKKSLIKDWRNGMSHAVPISATFNVFKYFNITPSISLNDRMYTSKIRRQWDPNASAEVADTVYGFYNVFDFNASLSLNTKIYGFFKPLKFLGDKVQMIRHVLTPNISFSFRPDFSTPFWGYYGTYDYTNPQGEVVRKKYNYFSHGIFGSVGEGKTGMVNLSLSNNVEMKVKSDNDSTGTKKISLIENFTVSQSYNFAADSLRWSNINTSILLRLTKGFNLNLSATWDPYTYQLNSSGVPVRVNKTRLQAGKGFAKLASTGTSFSYTFNNDTFRRKKKDNSSKDTNKEDSFDENNRSKSSKSKKGKGKDKDAEVDGDGYQKWEFPWSVSVNYGINYSYGTFNVEKMDYNGKFTQNLSISGNVRPTKNWSFNFSTSYNFDTGKLSYMNCSVSRDLHCFTMSASFVPVGPYKSYNFHIAVKSSLLSDLKWDKQSSTSNGITWY